MAEEKHPGQGRLAACLAANKTSVSKGCADAVQRSKTGDGPASDRREGRHDRREVRRGGTPTTDATKKTEGAKATEDEKQ